MLGEGNRPGKIVVLGLHANHNRGLAAFAGRDHRLGARKALVRSQGRPAAGNLRPDDPGDAPAIAEGYLGAQAVQVELVVLGKWTGGNGEESAQRLGGLSRETRCQAEPRKRRSRRHRSQRLQDGSAVHLLREKFHGFPLLFPLLLAAYLDTSPFVQVSINSAPWWCLSPTAITELAQSQTLRVVDAASKSALCSQWNSRLDSCVS